MPCGSFSLCGKRRQYSQAVYTPSRPLFVQPLWSTALSQWGLLFQAPAPLADDDGSSLFLCPSWASEIPLTPGFLEDPAVGLPSKARGGTVLGAHLQGVRSTESWQGKEWVLKRRCLKGCAASGTWESLGETRGGAGEACGREGALRFLCGRFTFPWVTRICRFMFRSGAIREAFWKVVVW